MHLTDEKLANMKSPVYLKLETMIETIDFFRKEMDGNRVPKFEQSYREKQKKEQERQAREAKRFARKQKK